MVGEKAPLLVIGKSKTLECFAGVENLPLTYVVNSQVWMTTEIFQDYLQKLADQHFHSHITDG